MKKLIIVLVALSFLGCNEIRKVGASKCIRNCVKREFSLFHNSESFSGSSSMDGLSQENIYDAVYDRCELFLNNESCYSNGLGGYYKYSDLSEIQIKRIIDNQCSTTTMNKIKKQVRHSFTSCKCLCCSSCMGLSIPLL